MVVSTYADDAPVSPDIMDKQARNSEVSIYFVARVTLGSFPVVRPQSFAWPTAKFVPAVVKWCAGTRKIFLTVWLDGERQKKEESDRCQNPKRLLFSKRLRKVQKFEKRLFFWRDGWKSGRVSEAAGANRRVC